MPRIRLDLSYDGTGFAGWARQPGLRTVQGTLEDGLGVVLRLDPPPRVTMMTSTSSIASSSRMAAVTSVTAVRGSGAM